MSINTTNIIYDIRIFGGAVGSGAATYMLAVIIYIASTLLWALRWYLALKRLGSRVTFLNVYTAIMGGILFNNITPSLKFGGEGFRAGWLRATEDVPVERSFITIIYERVTEIPGIATVFIVALFSSAGRLSALAASLPVMVGLAYMPVMIRDKVSSVKRRLGGDVRSLLRDWSLTLAASSIGIAIWLQDIARFYLIASSLGVHLSLGNAAVLSLGYLLFGMGPTPGGIGFVEGGLVSILAAMGVSLNKAGLIVLGERLISTVLASLLGVILVLLKGGIKLFREASRIARERKIVVGDAEDSISIRLVYA